jgi:hypothetical protein
MPARAAADAGEHAAVDEAIELALDQPRDQASTSDGSAEGRAMVTDSAVQRGVLEFTRAITRRQWGAGLGAAAVPVPSTGQRGVSDRVHPVPPFKRHFCAPCSSRWRTREMTPARGWSWGLWP